MPPPNPPLELRRVLFFAFIRFLISFVDASRSSSVATWRKPWCSLKSSSSMKARWLRFSLPCSDGGGDEKEEATLDSLET